ncbi:hypothetical protein [Wolbachia endosymbiont of Litomosoides brasiliensis]|nr:hypothetical protein [Wolbachia endosymbiont of Litomosoides brasiliensis]
MQQETGGEFYGIAIRELSNLVEKIREHPFNIELMNNARLWKV